MPTPDLQQRALRGSALEVDGIAEFFAARLRSVRIARGVSQTTLANALGTTAGVISRVEAGYSSVSLERLCAVARALHVEPGSLLPTLEQLEQLVTVEVIAAVEPGEVSPIPSGAAFVRRVIEGARRYLAQHGRAPRINSGPASAYVGFPSTWKAIDATLRQRPSERGQAGGLRALLAEHGLIARK